MAERVFSILCSIPIPLPSTPLTHMQSCTLSSWECCRPSSWQAHLLHPLKREKAGCVRSMENPSILGVTSPPQKASLLAQRRGWQEAPGGQLLALDRTGHGTLSLEIMLLPFPLPASNMRAVVSVRHPSPYCATAGGWRIGPPRGGSAVKSHSSVECAALWPEPGSSTIVRKG